MRRLGYAFSLLVLTRCRYAVAVPDQDSARDRDARESLESSVVPAIDAAIDAVDDGTGDDAAARDAVADSARIDGSDAEVAGDPIAIRRSGLRSRGVAITVDPGFSSQRYRVFYAGADGDLWLDVRDSATHARVCEASLGSPSGDRVVGVPAVAAPTQVVAAAIASERGTELWVIDVAGRSTNCGGIGGEWQRLSMQSNPGAMTTAPGAIAPRTETAGTLVIASAFSPGNVVVYRRTPVGAWMAPSYTPELASGVRIVSPPSILDLNATALHVLRVSPTGRASFTQMFWQDGLHWYDRWIDSQPASLPSASTLAVLFTADTNASFLFYAYTTLDNRVLVRNNSTAIRWAITSEWSDLGSPVAETLSAPALGFRRDGDGARTDVIMAVATETGARRVFVTEAMGATWTASGVRGWLELAGPFH